MSLLTLEDVCVTQANKKQITDPVSLKCINFKLVFNFLNALWNYPEPRWQNLRHKITIGYLDGESFVNNLLSYSKVYKYNLILLQCHDRGFSCWNFVYDQGTFTWSSHYISEEFEDFYDLDLGLVMMAEILTSLQDGKNTPIYAYVTGELHSQWEQNPSLVESQMKDFFTRANAKLLNKTVIRPVAKGSYFITEELRTRVQAYSIINLYKDIYNKVIAVITVSNGLKLTYFENGKLTTINVVDPVNPVDPKFMANFTQSVSKYRKPLIALGKGAREYLLGVTQGRPGRRGHALTSGISQMSKISQVHETSQVHEVSRPRAPRSGPILKQTTRLPHLIGGQVNNSMPKMGQRISSSFETRLLLPPVREQTTSSSIEHKLLPPVREQRIIPDSGIRPNPEIRFPALTQIKQITDPRPKTRRQRLPRNFRSRREFNIETKTVETLSEETKDSTVQVLELASEIGTVKTLSVPVLELTSEDSSLSLSEETKVLEVEVETLAEEAPVEMLSPVELIDPKDNEDSVQESSKTGSFFPSLSYFSRMMLGLTSS
jgi:hypothetical protein